MHVCCSYSINCIVLYCKSEAEVTNNKLRSRYCTAEANYRQARSIARPFCENRATCAEYKRFLHLTAVLADTTNVLQCLRVERILYFPVKDTVL